MIDYPTHLDRTDSEDRRSGSSKFDVTLSKAFSHLETQLDRLGVDSHRWDFDAKQRQKDKRPYSRANPDDPGFVLRWTIDEADYAVACDAYDDLRANVRAVGLWMKEKRMMEGRPVATAESEFANAALPPGDQDNANVVAVGPGGVEEPDPHEVLGVAPDAPPETVKGAHRQLQAKYHPDSGNEPDKTKFKQVNRAARELMTDD